MAQSLAILVLLVGACTAGPGQGSNGDREAWRTAALRDVVTGETFRIADFHGKVVAIEPMAVWCLNCRIQQGNAQAALDRVASPDVVYVSLDVDPHESTQDLAAYVTRWGFSWRFALAGQEVSRSLAASFGDQILSPPSTPLIVLAPDGTVAAREFGIKRVDELAAALEEPLP